MRYEDGVLKVVANCFVSNKRLREIIEQNSEWIKQRKNEASIGSEESSSRGKSVCKDDLTRRSGKPISKTKIRKNIDTQKPADRDNFSSGCNNCLSVSSGSKSHGKIESFSQLRMDLMDAKKTFVMGELVSVVSGANSKTYLDGNLLYINERFYTNRESRIKVIKSYLKKIAQLYVADEIANFGSKISLCPARIEFREIGDNWSKCYLATQRILCFDFRIAQLPAGVRKYLIVHAFAHFKNPIHDNNFWSFISRSQPSFRDSIEHLAELDFLKEIN